MKNFVCNQYGERLAKLEAIKNAISVSYLLNICRKFEFWIFNVFIFRITKNCLLMFMHIRLICAPIKFTTYLLAYLGLAEYFNSWNSATSSVVGFAWQRFGHSRLPSLRRSVQSCQPCHQSASERTQRPPLGVGLPHETDVHRHAHRHDGNISCSYVAWLRGTEVRTSVFGRRTFPVLRSTCSWQVG